MRISMIFSALAACALLTGCGNPEPSSKDIQSALQKYMLGPDSKIIDAEYIAVDAHGMYRQHLTAEKVSCKLSDDAPGAVCDFQISSCLVSEKDPCRPQEGVASGRFTKTNKGWTYIPTERPLLRPADVINEIIGADIMASGGIAP